MSDQCHECVWIITKLNQEYDELYNSYKKQKQENEELKKVINEDINFKEQLIFTDFNYHRVPFR